MSSYLGECQAKISTAEKEKKKDLLLQYVSMSEVATKGHPSETNAICAVGVPSACVSTFRSFSQ